MALFDLSEIIQDIDDRYAASSTFSQDQKLRWINKVIRRVWRKMPLDEISIIPTRKGDSVYELPADIEFEMIESVVVNTVEYKFRDQPQGLFARTYYKVIDGQMGEVSYMGIYPIPVEDNLDITIAYWKRPEDLTASDLGATPELRQDYLDIVVFGVLNIMAEIRQDVELGNNYARKYQDILDQIKREQYENMPQYPVIKDTQPRSNRYSVRGGGSWLYYGDR